MLTEEDTRRLEPNAATWRREYLAVPGDAVTAVCSDEDYAACTSRGVTWRPPIPGARYVIALDPGLRTDPTVLGAYHHEVREVAPGRVESVVVEDRLVVLKPTFSRNVKPEDVVAAAVELARSYAGRVYSDVYYFDVLAPALRERGVQVEEIRNTSPLISERVANLQARFGARTLDLLDDDYAKREMLTAQLQLHPRRPPHAEGAGAPRLPRRLRQRAPDRVRP